MKNLFTFLISLSFALTASAQVFVDTSGNVTVGDTTPPAYGHKMQVWGNAIFSVKDHIISAPLIRGNTDYSDVFTPDYTWSHDNFTGIFHPDTGIIAFTTEAKERMRITRSGKLLIGTTYEPQSMRVLIDGKSDIGALETFTNFSHNWAYAHVSYVNRDSTKNWVVVHDTVETFFVYGDGTAWTNGVVLTSDSVLKENVQTLQDAKSKVLQLRGVSYNFKPKVLNNPQDTFTVISNHPPRTEIGLIAEEVEDIVPEVVLTNNNGIKGICYQNLIGLFVEAFKQLNQTVDSLKEQLTLCCPLIPPPPGGDHRQINPNSHNDEPLQGARLDQNNPNPFNTKTEIHFYLPESATSKIILVFDMQGTLIKQYQLSSVGESSLSITAGELKAGMYLYTLVIDGKEIDTRRMILTN